MGTGLTNVHTRVLDQAGNVAHEFPDEAIMGGISTGEWLRLGGVDTLDERVVQPFFRGGVREEQPMRRLTGVVLLLRMTYTNYRPWEISPSPRCDVTVEALPSTWGFLGTDSGWDAVAGGPVQRTRTAVKLQVIHQGSVGQSKWENVVLRLVEAVVLFGLAHAVTGCLARCCLYRQSYLPAVVQRIHLRADGKLRLQNGGSMWDSAVGGSGSLRQRGSGRRDAADDAPDAKGGAFDPHGLVALPPTAGKTAVVSPQGQTVVQVAPREQVGGAAPPLALDDATAPPAAALDSEAGSLSGRATADTQGDD